MGKQAALWAIVALMAACGPLACMGLTSAGSEYAGSTAFSDTATGQDANATGAGDAVSDSNANGNAPAVLSPTPTPSPTALFNCDNANFPVCDGFETVANGALPDPNRWNSNVGPAPDDSVTSDHPTENLLEVSQAFAHRGKQSLHVHTVGGTEHLVIQDLNSAVFPAPFLPAPDNTFYVRIWLYDNGFQGDLTQVPPGSSHLYVVNASGPLAGRQQYEKFGAGDGPAGPATLNWNYYGPDAIATDANYIWPMGMWTCFETAFNGTTGELTVWQNEVEVPGIHIPAGQWQAPAYNRLTIGWEMDHPPSDFTGTDVYIDDVAYSYERIGCTK